jgi:hypothetical protein
MIAARRRAYERGQPEEIMSPKLSVIIPVLAVIPAIAQAQQKPPPHVAKPTMAQVQKVVQIVSGDKTKTQYYCEIGKLNEQMAEADQKNDTKRLESLTSQADNLAQKIGPEYIALMDGLSTVDENSAEGKQFATALDALDKLCGGR